MSLMAAGLILGGIQGILGMGAADQQAAQANMQARAQLAQARAQHQWQTMQGIFKNIQDNYQISEQKKARLRQNRAIAAAANQTAAYKKVGLREQEKAALIQVERGQKKALDSLTSAGVGAGINPNSGTMRALKNMLKEQGREGLKNMARNSYQARQNIDREQSNALASRDMNTSQQAAYFFPGPSPGGYIPPAQASGTQKFSALVGGLASGVQIGTGLTEAFG